MQINLFVLHRAPQPFQELVLPLRDLVRVNSELLGQLGDRPVALDRRQRDFRFEYRRVIPKVVTLHKLPAEADAPRRRAGPGLSLAWGRHGRYFRLKG
jgi:hypothetical protein